MQEPTIASQTMEQGQTLEEKGTADGGRLLDILLKTKTFRSDEERERFRKVIMLVLDQEVDASTKAHILLSND